MISKQRVDLKDAEATNTNSTLIRLVLEDMDIQLPRKNDLQPCFNRLKNLLDTLNGHTKYKPCLSEQLQSLHDDLSKIYDLLDQLLNECEKNIVNGELQVKFNTIIIQHNAVVSQLIEDFDKYDLTFSHILDIMELDEYESHFDNVIDLVELCNHSKNKLQLLLAKLKISIDIILEYHEILNDNMNTLDTIINENIDDLFRIQDIRYESPVRHMPSFTLKQLLTILKQDNNNGNSNGKTSSQRGSLVGINDSGITLERSQWKLPKFSPMEEKLINKFMDIQNNLRPIETSLLEIVPQRLQQFKKRHSNDDFVDITALTSQLDQEYTKILKNFKFLNSEVNCLRIDLIDKRWNIIFTNLNHELQFLLNEMDKNYITLSQINTTIEADNDNIEGSPFLPSYNIELKLKNQMDKNTRIISKTFDVIYAASEFSLLDQQVASRTNELAQHWVELRPKSDNLLLAVTTKLKQQLQSDTIESKLTRQPFMSNPQNAVDFLEPPPPILSTKSKFRRFSNQSISSNGSDSESDVGNRTIEAIKNDLRTFSLGSSADHNKPTTSQSSSNNKPLESSTLSQNSSFLSTSDNDVDGKRAMVNNNHNSGMTTLKTGAKLLQKMHIKPIIVSSSIAVSTSTDIEDDDDEENPFFDRAMSKTRRPATTSSLSKAARRQKTRSLILSTIPSLKHSNSNDSIDDDTSHDKDIPHFIREPLIHTVSSSLTMLSSPISVRPSHNLDMTPISSPMTSPIPETVVDYHSNADITADTVIINDIDENPLVTKPNDMVDTNNHNTVQSFPGLNQLDSNLLNTPIEELHGEIPTPHSLSSLPSISPSSASSFIDTTNEIAKEGHVSLEIKSKKAPVNKYSSEMLYNFLQERITVNKNKHSLIPRIQNIPQNSSKPFIKTRPSLSGIPKPFIKRRIRTPTPLSELLAGKTKA